MLLVRGTHDLLPQEAELHNYIIELARNHAYGAGFSEIITPILEHETVFLRTLGETSDIVRKEMFVLEQKGSDPSKEAIILRPEGTAPIMRALLTQGLQQHLPQKLFYAGPMFRYDRPQKGRLRQFHQFGVEMIGCKSPWAEIDAISVAFSILRNLKISDITLEINTLGDAETRSSYRKALVEYFSDVREYLSPESQVRLEKNPLRILDSKAPEDKKLMQEAPFFRNYLTPFSEEYFETILKELGHLDIPFKINPHLVRGLDYYSHTVFEVTTDDLGSQSTLLAGGRYDSLSTLMGSSQEIPAVGWACGIERLALLLNAKDILPSSFCVAVIPLSQETTREAFEWCQKLRKDGFPAHFIPEGKVPQKFKTAVKLGASCGLILGNEESQSQTFMFKNFTTGEQEKIPHAQTLSFLKSFFSSLK